MNARTNMRIVPARQGLAWLVNGWGLFRRSPMAWLALTALYWFIVAVLNVLPFAGPIIATMLLPAFSVSFMHICVEVEAGRTPSVAALWAGFQERLPTLIALGGLYLAAMLLTLGLSALADGGVVFKWIVLEENPSRAAIDDHSLENGLLVAAAVGTPILMAFWFAPVLAAWRGMGAAQALFYSFFAGLRNWRAFLLYGAGVCLAGMVMSLVLVVFAALIAGNAAALRGAMLGLTIVMLPTVFASFYCGYRDVFPEPKPRPAKSEGSLPPAPPILPPSQ